MLLEWNGLMLGALAEAAAATGNQQWLEAAIKNGGFLLDRLRRPNGRWLRSWQAGDGDRPAQARHLAYAADYAAIADALHPAWARPPAKPAGSTRLSKPPTGCSSCSGITSGAGCSPQDQTPRN